MNKRQTKRTLCTRTTSFQLRFKFFLWYFCRFKVPLLGYLRPKIICLKDESLIIRIPLCRRSKNHLHSMYFAALAAGADLAAGLYGFYFSKLMDVPVSLAFKSFQAQFLKRAEDDVYFICEQGERVKTMIEESLASQKRINQSIHVQGFVNYPENPELVAEFTLELSIKALLR